MAEYTCPDCGTKLKNKSGVKAHEKSQKHLSATVGSSSVALNDEEYGQPSLADLLAEAGASPPMSGEIGALRDKIKFDHSKPWQAVYDQYVKTAANDNPKSLTIGGNSLKERDVIRQALFDSRRSW